MQINTKFDKGDVVLIINNNELLWKVVHDIRTYYDKVEYEFLIRQGNSLDREQTIWRPEENVYTNVNEIPIG